MRCANRGALSDSSWPAYTLHHLSSPAKGVSAPPPFPTRHSQHRPDSPQKNSQRNRESPLPTPRSTSTSAPSSPTNSPRSRTEVVLPLLVSSRAPFSMSMFWISAWAVSAPLALPCSPNPPPGEGLAILPPSDGGYPWPLVIPFALPNERVRITIRRNNHLHSTTSLVQVLSPNTELRDMSRVRCKYFGECGGCQYQVCNSSAHYVCA